MLEQILFNLIWILPFLTVLACVPVSAKNVRLLKQIHLGSAGIVLLISLFLAGRMLLTYEPYAGGNAFQLSYLTDLPWIAAISSHYLVGADALSILMLVLATVIIFTGILASWKLDHGQKVFFALIQILAASVYGVFMSFDLALFFVFYEMEALCMYLIIAGYGSGDKDYGGKKLTLTLAVGSAMVLAVLIGVFIEGGSWSLLELANVKLPEEFQMWAFPLLFMGFAVSSSLFPFHFWSPAGHSSAPTAVSMFAAGVMMKMGAYGCLRVALYLMPEAAKVWLPYVLAFVIFNVVLGPFIAMRHKDLKYITAYSSISHLGLIFLGLAAVTPVSLRGAALQMLSHGFLTGLFFATIGMIYGRTHTRDITQMGGIMKVMPFLGVGFVIAGFAGLGLPGFSGFVAESTIFIGSFQNGDTFTRVVTILAILSITATAVYILQTANRMLHGPIRNPHFAELTDADFEEKVVVVIFVLFLLLLGLCPAPFADFLDTSISPIYANLVR